LSDDCQYCENCKKILQPGDLMFTIANVLGIEQPAKIVSDDIYFCSLDCGEEWIDNDEDEW
jgi:hypothetical protein